MSLIGPQECCRVRSIKSTAHSGKLCVVEGIESFPAEFNGLRFFNGEMFEDAHVKIGAKGQVKEVPAGIFERKPPRSGKRTFIEQKGTSASGGLTRGGMGIADEVGTRIGTSAVDPVSAASIVRKNRIRDVERDSALECSDPRALPAAQEGLRQPRRFAKERQIVNVAEVQDVPLVELRASFIARPVIGIQEAKDAVGSGCVQAI